MGNGVGQVGPRMDVRETNAKSATQHSPIMTILLPTMDGHGIYTSLYIVRCIPNFRIEWCILYTYTYHTHTHTHITTTGINKIFYANENLHYKIQYYHIYKQTVFP